jgi:hypothetical protein
MGVFNKGVFPTGVFRFFCIGVFRVCPIGTFGIIRVIGFVTLRAFGNPVIVIRKRALGSISVQHVNYLHRVKRVQTRSRLGAVYLGSG